MNVHKNYRLLCSYQRLVQRDVLTWPPAGLSIEFIRIINKFIYNNDITISHIKDT